MPLYKNYTKVSTYLLLSSSDESSGSLSELELFCDGVCLSLIVVDCVTSSHEFCRHRTDSSVDKILNLKA